MEDLIRELGPKLKRVEQISASPGVATGWANLDRYLLAGLPQSGLEFDGERSRWRHDFMDAIRRARNERRSMGRLDQRAQLGSDSLEPAPP